MDQRQQEPRNAAGLAVGLGLVVLGLWWFVRNSNIIPAFVFDLINRVAWPLVLIIVGAAIILVAQRAHAPAAGTRLYRSRGDRWIAGVLGGLGQYFGVDPVILRIAFIVLAIVGFGGLVVAYIIAAIIIPEEPLVQPTPPVV